MNNTAHNLPIDDIIKALQEMKIHGVQYVDATIHSTHDIGFKPAPFRDDLPAANLRDLNLLDLI